MTRLDDAAAMARALELADARRGRTWPNPPVGAVLVRDGVLVGEGAHPGAGEPHAEVFALRDAGAAARGATAYVTLEPCCHTGRTPPCAEALIAAGVAEVVYACGDPDPRVDGGGRARLEAAGIRVRRGVGAAAAKRQLAGFFTRVRAGRPRVLLKAGMSLDGQLAPASGVSRWITSAESRRRAHRLRDRVDAVLVGSGTALADRPRLTTRDPAPADGRQPLRILLDGRGRTPPDAPMLGAGAWVFTAPGSPGAWRAAVVAGGAELHEVPPAPGGGLDLGAVLAGCGDAGLTEVLVEGGGRVHGALLAAGLADAVELFVAPRLLGAGGHGLTGAWRAAEVAGGVAIEDLRVEASGPDFQVSGELRYPGPT